MVHEIISRGKRLDNGEWIEGYYVCSKGNINKNIGYILPSVTSVSVEDNYIKIGRFVAVDYDTVCRYTGLPDKNGVKIFEGDILHFINTYHNANTEWLCVVEFLLGSFVCRYIEKEGRYGNYNHFISWNYPFVKWDVIGNIHDNPELLEVKNETKAD